jgi:hypothetical protein
VREEPGLEAHVAFFRALQDPEKERFRQIVKVFLREVRINGLKTMSIIPFVSWLPPARRSLSSDSTIGNTIAWAKCSSPPALSERDIKPPGVPPRTFLARSDGGSYVV